MLHLRRGNSVVIAEFEGKHDWLSNRFLSPIRWYPDLTFKAVEYGFVYFKTTNPQVREKVLACPDPYAAHAFGRAMAMRPDWDEIKFGIMYELVKQKFEKSPELTMKLIRTGDVLLVEGNTEHDNIWGDCKCDDCSHIPGENWLGKILMSLRAQFRE